MSVIASVLASLLLAAPLPPIALENEAVRVEVDPQLMSVRYFGPPEGPNLVEPLHVEPRDRRLGEWLDAGGVTWDIAGAPSHDATLRRGPAEVLVQTPTRVVLLSPPDPATPFRIKLEFRITAGKPEVAMAATVSTEEDTASQPVSLRCSFRVRQGSLVGSYDARSATVFPLDQPKGNRGLPVTQWDGVLFDAGAVDARPLVATAFGPSAVIDRAGYKVIREVEGGTASPADYARASNLHAVSDPRTHTYGLVMESPRAPVGVAAPLVYRETWRLTAAE